MKRNIVFYVFVSITLSVLASMAIANDKEGPVTGTWDCQSKGGPQGDMPFTLSLEQSGENVDGSVSSPIGGTQISSGSFKSNTLEIHIDSPDGSYVLVAKYDKDTLSGTWSIGNDKGTWEGKKQAAPAK
jgi:hypothetical protein